MSGDATLFLRADEIESSWQYCDSVLAAWREPARCRCSTTPRAPGDRRTRTGCSRVRGRLVARVRRPRPSERPVQSAASGGRPVLVRVAAAIDLHVAELSLACAPATCNRGTRLMTSIARLKRSISLSIASSSGVLMLPSPCSRARAGCGGWCAGRRAGGSARVAWKLKMIGLSTVNRLSKSRRTGRAGARSAASCGTGRRH